MKRIVRQNWGWIIVAFGTTFVSILLQLVWTLNIGKLADSIVDRNVISGGFVMIMAILMVGNGVLQYLNQIVNRYTSEKMAHSLRMNFAGDIFYRDSGGQPAGYEAMSKVQNELMQASEYMSSTLFDIVGMMLSGIFALFFLLFQNAKLTVIILVPMIFVVVFVEFLGRKLVSLVHESLDRKVRHNKFAHSAIENFETVLVFEAKDYFAAQYEKELEDWATAELKKERISAICNSFSGVLSQVPLLILFAAGTLLIWKGEMTMGVLTIFLNMVKTLLRTLMNLPTWMVSIRKFLVHLSGADISQGFES